MKNRVLYVGSFDPFTLGHYDVYLRACSIFGKENVDVGVGKSGSKTAMFSQGEKTKIIHSYGVDYSNIVNPSGLTVDFAVMNGYTHIVKGIRNFADFDYELAQFEVGLAVQNKIDTLLLPSNPKTANVSSSIVKELVKNGGIVTDYVNLFTKQCLELKNKRLLIGVTGGIACGKSTMCHNLTQFDSHDVQITTIDFDMIAKRLFEGNTSLSNSFLSDVSREFGTINRKELGVFLFKDKSKLDRYNSLIRNPMLTELRLALSKLTGVVLIEGALLVEFNMTDIVNDEIIFVDQPDDKIIMDRLYERGMSTQSAKDRLSAQLKTCEKKELFHDIINHRAFKKNYMKFDDKLTTTEIGRFIISEYNRIILAVC